MDARALARLSALVLALAACSSAPEPAPSPVVEHVRVTSPGIDEDGFIDQRYTCDGVDEPLPLEWSGLPTDSMWLAITISDPDAGGFNHWVAYNIPARVHRDGLDLSDGNFPTAENDFGEFDYSGPCPPPGGGPHHYEIKVHVLPAAIEEAQEHGTLLFREIERLRIDGGTLIGLYERKE